MKPDEYTEDKPKNHFEWGYLYKVYLVILIAVFLLALANQANAGVFLEINGNMDYYDSQLPLGDIMQNSDTWDAVSNYMNDVHGVPFPSYSEATQMDDLLENVLMYYVGQYCNLSGTTAQQVFDACMDFTDTASQVWDLLTLDLESGDIIRNPHYSDSDLSGVIHGVVDPLIYTTPSPSDNELAVGAWYYVPYDTGWLADPNNSLRSARQVYSTSSTNSCFITVLSNGTTLVASYEYQAVVVKEQWTKINSSGQNYVTGTYNMTCSNTYQGSESVGYYSSRSDTSTVFPSDVTRYTSRDAALADLFGQSTLTPSGGDPYLNGDGYIINDDPSYSPLSGYSALNYPYRTKIVENYTNTTDPDDPVSYPEGVNTVEPSPVYKDVPTWLVDPSVDIPEEPDYLENVDVELPEIEPDTGFITDCYNALPSGIVSMIAVGLGLGVVMKIIS